MPMTDFDHAEARLAALVGGAKGKDAYNCAKEDFRKLLLADLKLVLEELSVLRRAQPEKSQ